MLGNEWLAIERKKEQFNAWADDFEYQSSAARQWAILQAFRIYWAYLFAAIAGFRFARPIAQLFQFGQRSNQAAATFITPDVPQEEIQLSHEMASESSPV
jgi:hypothetical protein